MLKMKNSVINQVNRWGLKASKAKEGTEETVDEEVNELKEEQLEDTEEQEDDKQDKEEEDEEQQELGAQALLELQGASKSKKGKKAKGRKGKAVKSVKPEEKDTEIADEEPIPEQAAETEEPEEPEAAITNNESTDANADDDVNANADADVVADVDADADGAAADSTAEPPYTGAAQDSVEAAVYRYVGNTLENHDESTDSPDKKRKAFEDVNLQMNEYGDQPWQRFLNDDDIDSNHSTHAANPVPDDFNVFATSQARKKRRMSIHSSNTGNVDPELENIDGSNTDALTKTQLAAAIMQASAVASTLSPEHQANIPEPPLLHRVTHPGHHTLSTPRVSRRESKRISWTGDGTETGGSFTKDESALIEEFMDAYQQKHGLSRRGLCNRVWANERKKDNFWDAVAGVLPHRTRASVYKHVRRAYHVFEVRGKWQPNEDEELGRLVETRGPQWKQIGMLMSRMPEDCRDRWRNYVKCGNQRMQNKWSAKEEEVLRQVVADMLPSEGGTEGINWTAVSERMGGTRSRIQCRYKWNKINKKAASARVEEMNLADRALLLARLKQSNYDHESQIDWAGLAALDGGGPRFSGKELSIAYYKMKNTIPDYEHKSFAEVIHELQLNIKANSQAHQMNKFRVDVSGDVRQLAAGAIETDHSKDEEVGYMTTWTA